MAYTNEFNIKLAEAIILNDYGDSVSVLQKKKNLLKFGENPAVDTNGATVMNLAGTETEETYVYRNLITHIASDNSADTMIITVEGHTVGDDVSVSSITQTGGTATCTTSAAHGFSANEWVYIEGANEAGYNGVVQVATAPTTTTFTYTVASGTSSPATGTITVTSQNKTFVTQNVTLAGTTKTALSTPPARATRAFVPEQNKATDVTGKIYVAEDVTFSSGVPQTDSAVHLIINTGRNQSQKASTSLSNTDYWIITGFRGSVLNKTGTVLADVSLEVRRPGGVFRQVEDVTATNSASGVYRFDPYIIVPKNSDVRLWAVGSTTNVDVTGSIDGYLAVVI